MDNIPKDTIKAELHIRFLKLEKEDKHREPLPLTSEHGDFSDPWIQKKTKEVVRQYSMERKMRVDFKLKNVYFKNPSKDKDGKFEYTLFFCQVANIFNGDN